MSLRKLSAGDGYTYLTRQVAAQDVTHRGRDGLASYYADRGESPGVWLGSAAHGRDGFPAVGQAVSEAQMVALFGEGRHPNADVIETRLIAARRSVGEVLAASKLGAAYRTESGGPSPLQWTQCLKAARSVGSSKHGFDSPQLH